ncbi:MAG: transketolase [Bacteroidota bacterium]
MQDSTNVSSDFIIKAANIVRGLSMDGVQRANSGHPGLPMGAAEVATVLWTKFLKHNPKDTEWADRDRFVLSGGHGSMLIYSLLHLAGYDVSIDDLKNFRQWHSKTPGHPEYGDTAGVEITTGPLGQGISSAVGFALAENSLAARYNEDGLPIVDHYTYVMAGDGDVQEGVSHESCSLAAHLKLGKLIVLYDDNNVTIDGKTALSFTEDVMARYQAYGWHTQTVDGHDPDAVTDAIIAAQNETNKPSIISCKTIIGKGSPNKQNTSGVHGSPLGPDEIKLTKEALGLPDEEFYVADDVLDYFRNSIQNGAAQQDEWNNLFSNYADKFPEKAKEFNSLNDVDKLSIESFTAGESKATRSASGAVLSQIASQLPALMGGSADLSPSNNTFPSGETAYSSENKTGRYIHYGVREHAMGSIMNGLALHGGVIPYGGTFFVFSDYMRPAIRMAALMGIRVVYVLTHDSIGLGEDGPTHQPIAHLASLRAMPNVVVFRPADANETMIGWQEALKRTDGPTCLVLTRQNLPVMDANEVKEASKGGYVLAEDENYEAIVIATGSEVEIALDAKMRLNEQGKKVRVVSMPSTELFEAQSADYRDSVLPSSCKKRVAIEAGATQSWYKYVGLEGKVIGIDRFGASAPYKELYEKYGITADAVVDAVNDM